MFYVVLFSAAGLNQPFLPIWLAARDLDEAQIALVISAPLALRVLVAPAFGAAADRAPSRRLVVRLLAVMAFLLALALFQAERFWPILLLATAMMLLSQTISPIVDASVLNLVRQGVARDFGRIRLWGSVSFAGASLLGGLVLDYGGADAVLGSFVAATGAVIAASFLLPATPARASGSDHRPFRLFQQPTLPVVFTVAALVLASHATFNSFGSIQLRASGYPSWSIGMFWALATSAEIAMFWAGPLLARVLTPSGMLMLAAGAGVCRWSLMALDPGFVATALLQLMHAATFSGSWLGLMQFVRVTVGDEVGARAQSAFVTVLGIMLATATLATGPLYRHLGSGAYVFAAALPLLAIGLLLAFRGPLRAAEMQEANGGEADAP